MQYYEFIFKMIIFFLFIWIQNNIENAISQNRIGLLEEHLRNTIDANLIHNFIDNTLEINDSKIKVRINYFICNTLE